MIHAPGVLKRKCSGRPWRRPMGRARRLLSLRLSLTMPDDAPYSLWIAGTKRFAVVRGKTVCPVLGYVFRNHDGAWVIERKGKILETVYRTFVRGRRGSAEVAKAVARR